MYDCAAAIDLKTVCMPDVPTFLMFLQVVEVQGLEGSELRNKVGANIADGSIVSLTGIDMDPNPVLRHAGQCQPCIFKQ